VGVDAALLRSGLGGPRVGQQRRVLQHLLHNFVEHLRDWRLAVGGEEESKREIEERVKSRNSKGKNDQHRHAPGRRTIGRSVQDEKARESKRKQEKARERRAS